MEPADAIASQPSLFSQNSYWFKTFLILVFILAFLIRIDEIRATGHLVEREYNSAIFARAFYFDGNDNIEQWRQENARQTRDQFPVLEPPVTEYLVSLIYRVMGQEQIWYARYLTSLFWLIGGIFFYRIVKILISSDAALFALIYYLFVPMGIIISRSFQPDSLMMMMFLISLYAIVLYFKDPSWKLLILSAVIVGLTLLFRPLVLFALFGAFAALSILNKDRWNRTFLKQAIVFTGLSLAFPFAFYGWGIYVAGFLQSQADLSFRPWLLTRWQYWLGWFENGARVALPSFLVTAVLGFFLLQKRIAIWVVSGLLIAYFFFGLFFTFHIYTHPYYHLQIIPIVGISAAPLFVGLATSLKKSLNKFWLAPAIAVFLIGLYFSHSEVRNSLYKTTFENPTLAREIGDSINHNARTVFVAYHYGLPLEYYGEFSGAPWPVRIDDPFLRSPNEKERTVQERLNALGFMPEKFVITQFDMFYRIHQDLQGYLEEYCILESRTDQYMIYSSCKSITQAE